MEYRDSDFKELLDLGIKWILIENKFKYHEIYISLNYINDFTSPPKFKGYVVFITDTNNQSKRFDAGTSNQLLGNIKRYYNSEDKLSKEEMTEIRFNDIQNLYLSKVSQIEKVVKRYNW